MGIVQELNEALEDFGATHGKYPSRLYLTPPQARALAAEAGVRWRDGENFSWLGVPATITEHPEEQRILDCMRWSARIERAPNQFDYRFSLTGDVGGDTLTACLMLSDEIVDYRRYSEGAFEIAARDLHRVLIGNARRVQGLTAASPFRQDMRAPRIERHITDLADLQGQRPLRLPERLRVERPPSFADWLAGSAA